MLAWCCGTTVHPRGTSVGMNVNLTPELETLVGRKVTSGMYVSASELPGTGLSRHHADGQEQKATSDR